MSCSCQHATESVCRCCPWRPVTVGTWGSIPGEAAQSAHTPEPGTHYLAPHTFPAHSVDLGRAVTVIVALRETNRGGEVVFPYAHLPAPNSTDALDMVRYLLGTRAVGHSDIIRTFKGAGAALRTTPLSHVTYGTVVDRQEAACKRKATARVVLGLGDALVLFNHHPDTALDRQAVWGICSPRDPMQLAVFRYRWSAVHTDPPREGRVALHNRPAELLDACGVSPQSSRALDLDRGGAADQHPRWAAANHLDSAGLQSG